jgi:hypothetical protein
MEIRHRLLEFSWDPKYELLKKELDRIGASYEIKIMGYSSTGVPRSHSIEFNINESDALYPVVEQLIDKYEFSVQTDVHYDKEDFDKAEWFYTGTGEYQYPQPEDDPIEYLKATYDTCNFCPTCGMGAIQNNPFRLKTEFKQKNSQFLGLHWVFDEIFVRNEAKAILERECPAGIRFTHPVYHRTSEEMESVYQLRIETVVKEGLVTSGLDTVTCKPYNEEYKGLVRQVAERLNLREEGPYCGRVKYHYPTRDTVKFRHKALSQIPDIVKSDEDFGSGHSADKLVLVSKRFRELIVKYKLRGLRFTPIELM